MERTEIIDELYAAFSHVEKPSKMIGCECGSCLSNADCKRLLSQDLRSAKPHLIGYLTSDIIYTVGDEKCFKYFLPRILELIMVENLFVMLPRGLLKRLANSGIENWDQRINDASKNAIKYIMNDLLMNDDQPEYDDWLAGVCYLHYDANSFLSLIEKPEFLELKNSMIKGNLNSMRQGRMTGPSWDDIPTIDQKPVYDWLTNDGNIAFMMDLGYLKKDPRLYL